MEYSLAEALKNGVAHITANDPDEERARMTSAMLEALRAVLMKVGIDTIPALNEKVRR